MKTSSVPGVPGMSVEDGGARGHRLHDADDDPAEERARQAGHAAEHRGGERGDQERAGRRCPA